MNLNTKNILLILLILTVYITTAYFSSGYHHADEHYQIIEFANYKLGDIGEEQLPWEYKAKIRPAIQPWIATSIFKIADSLSITNNYTKVFILRLLTAFLTIFSLFIFYLSLKKRKIINSEYKYVFILLLFLLWFTPYIGVRFSSETWSANLFLIGISIYLIKPKISDLYLFIAGLILGLSFLFRFQVGILIVSFFAWLFFIEKIRIRKLLIIVFGILASLLFGVLLDSLFYNSFVITPVNYFIVNIIEDKASFFGTEPWWMVINYIYKFPTKFIGVVMLLSLLYYILKKPKSLFTFLVLPFILIHIIIPHKELRFLFPVLVFTPIFIYVLFIDIIKFVKHKKLFKIAFIVFISVFITINSIGLVANAVKSADSGRMYITEYINYNYKKQQINIYHSEWRNPYVPWVTLYANFYMTENLSFSQINNINSIKLDSAKTNLLLVDEKFIDENEAYIKNNNFVFKTQSVPEWILFANKYQQGVENSHVIYLYEKK